MHRILAARSRRASRRPEAASLGAAFLLHALALAAVLILPRLQPKPEPLQFVPVQVIPAQALGVRRPAPPKQKPVAEAPRPVEPEPEPPAQEEPEVAPPPKPDDDVPVLPREEPKKPEPQKPETKKPEPKKPEPRSTAPKTGEETRPPQRTPPTDAPPGVAPGESGDQLGRRGGATGSPLGTTAFGSRIGVDNPEFTYGYYLDRLLSLIDAQWQRPNMGEVQAVIHFTIERDGSISDLRVAESSGYNSFDYAALRAVQNAAPFPPLPRGYRGDSLGVNLIVH